MLHIYFHYLALIFKALGDFQCEFLMFLVTLLVNNILLLKAEHPVLCTLAYYSRTLRDRKELIIKSEIIEVYHGVAALANKLAFTQSSQLANNAVCNNRLSIVLIFKGIYSAFISSLSSIYFCKLLYHLKLFMSHSSWFPYINWVLTGPTLGTLEQINNPVNYLTS